MSVTKPTDRKLHVLELIYQPYYRLMVERAFWHARETPPIIVYQMGKVGSSTVTQSLRAVMPKAPIIQIHVMSIEGIRRGKMYERGVQTGRPRYLQNHLIRQKLENRIAEGRQTKFISLVRDPIARNVSSFVQNQDLYFDDLLGGIESGEISREEIQSKYFEMEPHRYPLDWFDRELFPTIGVDVYATTFPADDGYQIITEGPIEVLILKLEKLSDARVLNALAMFVGLEELVLESSNVGESKDTAAIYSQLKSGLIYSDEFVSEMYESKYARHFYSESELAGFRSRLRIG